MERGDVEVTHQIDGKPQEAPEAVGIIQQLDCGGDQEDGTGSPTCRPSSPSAGPDSSVICDPDAGCDHESGSPGNGPSSATVDSALSSDNVENCDVSSKQETIEVQEESVHNVEEGIGSDGNAADSSVNVEGELGEDTPGNDTEEVDNAEKLGSTEGPTSDELTPETGDKQGDTSETIDSVPEESVVENNVESAVQSDSGENSESDQEEDGQIEGSDSVHSEVEDTVQTENSLENNVAPDSTDTGDLFTREDEGKSANEDDPEPVERPLETEKERQSSDSQPDSTQTKVTGESQSRSPVLSDSRTALNDDHGELDYDEDDDKEDDGADQSVDDKGEVDSEKEEGEADDDDDEDGELADKSDDGEIDEDDCEEGEIKDGDIRRPFQRHLCRFYNRGHCTWGSNCRFLHPGVNDKGNYSMLERPGFNHNRFNRPPGRSWNGPEPAPEAAAPPPEELPPPPPEEPRQESAWERGLRQAKELMKKASQKKELETNIEEKRMNLSLNDFPEEKKFNDPYYDDILDDPYYGNNIESVNNARPQPYENFEVHWSREPDYHFKEREPSFERPRHVRNHSNHRHRVSPSPDSRLRRRQRDGRVEVPVRDGAAPVKSSSAKGDEWHDPWQRTNKDQKQVKKKGRSRSGSRGRRRGRSSSYSSFSSRSSSRSSFSSHSSRSSYSRSSSSYSSRSSASRSPSPSQRRKVATKRPLQNKPSEPPRSTVSVKAAPPPANAKPLDKRRPGDGTAKLVDKPPGKGPVKGPAPTRSPAVSQKAPSAVKPTSTTKQAMPSAGRTQPTTAKASVPAGNGKPSAPGKPNKPVSPTKAPKQPPVGDRGRAGTRQIRKRRSPSSSGSSRSGSSSSRSRSRSSSASSFSSLSGSSSDSADSDDLYGDIAPVKRKSRKTVDKSKKPLPAPPPASAPPVVSTAKPDKPEVTKPPKTKERQPGTKVTTKGTSAQSASQPATIKAKDPLKVQGQKSAIKLTLISKPTPAQIMSKKRGAVEEAFQQPAAKKQAMSAKSDRDQKNAKESTSKPTKNATAAAKPPEKVAVKRPASPSAKVVKAAPVQNKVAAANAAKKSTSSRREELLKQLKAVEDAIARKRSKLT